MKGCEKTFELDASHTFPVGKPVPVSGNTAAMVGEGGISWLSSRFKVRCLCACLSTVMASVLEKLIKSKVLSSLHGVSCTCADNRHSRAALRTIHLNRLSEGFI